MGKLCCTILAGFWLLLLTGCATVSPAGFTEDQQVMIRNGDAQTPMRVFKITSESDSVLLRTASKPVRVDKDDPLLELFVDRLYATVRDSQSLGLGIAAPQVGILKNIIWVQRLDKTEEDMPFEVYLNPEIVEYSAEKQINREGCLSIPNRSAECERAQTIVLEYDKMDGSHARETISDFTAVIFQHEVDHLNGILYLDHLAEHRRARP
ncbi:peptide deformylase [Neolewinella xylanilytica]|uniref:Peptide deformylase n=1 Tax=Neolewinella xylanilytica TaxID=1514080 RepID=A0A2S6I4Y8_9BACT|nr:peptide deformylase [Neolewinella xylanilytica]PPK86212.1 peptide deformylase [Neolewinella xylanilytica]